MREEKPLDRQGGAKREFGKESARPEGRALFLLLATETEVRSLLAAASAPAAAREDEIDPQDGLDVASAALITAAAE